MRLSRLNARIEELEKRVSELELVKATDYRKRPEPYRGRAEKLNADLTAASNELRQLYAWRRGNWYVDDLGVGGGLRPRLAA